MNADRCRVVAGRRISSVALKLAVAAGMAVGVSAGTASAQWSGDSFSPLNIASGSGDRNQPKIVPTPDGGCYVTWFDNATGGYDVRIQRLDELGNPVFTSTGPGGILVADRGFSSTQDYDLIIDSSGHAVVVYRDDQPTPGVVEVSAQRVSPDGVFTWGPTGVVASNGVGSANQPKVTQIAGGDYIVGWSQDNGWRAHRLDASGDKVWVGDGLLDFEASRPRTLNALQPGGDASDPDGLFIASYIRATGTGFTAARHIYSQKFDSTANRIWNGGADAIIFDSSSIQLGNFPPFQADGAGGAAYSWYETGAQRNAYLRLADADGVLSAQIGVIDPAAAPGRIHVSASSAVGRDGQTYLAATQTNDGTQNQNNVVVQRIKDDGTRSWGDTGVSLFTNTSDSFAFVQVLAACDGAVVVGIRSPGFGQGSVFAAKIDDEGTVEWITDAANSSGGKTRLAAVRGTPNGNTGAFTLLAFGDGEDSARNIAVVRINDDGSLGFGGDNECPADTNPCPCDYNDNGLQEIGDYFSFLTAFFAQLGGPGNADFDGDGTVTIGDYFAFLGCLPAIAASQPCS